MAKKTVDPLKAKERKQKIVAAVLGVIFLVLVAIQGPKVWKQLHPAPPAQASEPEPTTTAAPPAGTPPLAAPTLQGSAPTASAPTAPAPTASATPPIQDGVLASFSRFASKDPFAQQLSNSNSADSSGSNGSKGSSGSGAGSLPAYDGGSPSPGVAPAPGSAVIAVNGTPYQVAVGTDFPQATDSDPSVVPLFHLVSLTARSAKISIVGGSYANGAKTVTLTQNKPVTLMNTADGTRYTLVLKPQGSDAATDSGSSSDPTTVTLPPATP